MNLPNNFCITLLLSLPLASTCFNCHFNCNCSYGRYVCRSVNSKLLNRLSNLDEVVVLEIHEWLDERVNLAFLSNFSRLSSLSILDSKADRLIVPPDGSLPSLLRLTVTGAGMSQTDFATLSSFAPSLLSVNLSRNGFTEANLLTFRGLRNLDLSFNKLAKIPILPSSLNFLNLSSNRVSSLTRKDLSGLTNLLVLDLSYNRLVRVSGDAFAHLVALKSLLLRGNNLGPVPEEAFRSLRMLAELDLSSNRISHFGSSLPTNCILESLDFSSNPLEKTPRLRCVSLKRLLMSNTRLTYVQLESFRELPSLKELDVSYCSFLQNFVGNVQKDVPSLEHLNVAWCALDAFPMDFFANSSVKTLWLDGNNWQCDCRVLWALSLPEDAVLKGINKSNCFVGANQRVTNVSIEHCPKIGIAEPNGRVQRVRLGVPAYIKCGEYGYPAPTVLWEAFSFGDVAAFEPLCAWDADSKLVVRYNGEDHLTCIPGGAIQLVALKLKDGVPLRCRVRNLFGSASSVTMVRFDFSCWSRIKIYSVISAIATMFGLFLVNIAYIFIRRLVVWRISKMKRTGLVRRTLEAMERYRQRQLDALYEMYTCRMQQIVDNYHQQVDQLKKSYAQQSDRFRDYRAAQMESVTQHFDTLCGSYGQQATRIRDYGCRQMERLWESYQRQLNRLRTFTVQQRVRMMRQYRLRQKYFNKVPFTAHFATMFPFHEFA
ncbi:Leucine Rich Repeat family protein [Trichuris trichiura]|uniref:Leucine Rich Repeat family protein n=1 Tax=Trichuris trichiura TaxID=36087 RepID=A0A077ZII9_TRITR|nr:Leucine Rich Repeat family protein [Trichuris trichiura]